MPIFEGSQGANASGTFNDVRGDQYNTTNINTITIGDLRASAAHIENHPSLSRTPPAKPSIFFGRDDLVNKSVNLIKSVPPARIAILGAGGIGKTSLALSILYDTDLDDLFDQRRYFVSCEAVTSSDQLVDSILHVLGAPKSSKEDGQTVLHNCLVSSKPLLLVLDNFETPWGKSDTKVEDVLQRVAVEPVTLVVTMRGSVSPYGIQWTQQNVIPSLSLKAAHEAFLAAKSSMMNSEPDVELQLLKELDCVPLAVKLIAQLAKSLKPHILLRRWQKEKTKLLKTRGKEQDCLSCVDISITLSLDSIRDEPEAVQLLSLISHLPDGVFRWEERLHEIMSDFESVDNAAAILQAVSLTYDDGYGTLKVLSPIRHYMLEKHPCWKGHFAMLEDYYYDLIHQYSNTAAGPNFKEACDMLLPERGNITSLIAFLMKTNPSEDMVYAAYDMSKFLYFVYPSLDLLEEVLPHIQISHMAKIHARVNQLMGDILMMQCRDPDATKKLEKAQQQFTEIGDILRATQCMRSLGNILQMQHRYPEAIEKLEKAQQQFTEIGYILGATQCMQSLGDILGMQHRYPEAIEKLEKAQQQFTEIGDILGATQCMQSLGDILRMQCRYPEAIEKLKKAQQQFTEIGNILGATQCMQNLGNILQMQHRYPEAIEKLEKAQQQFTEIYHILRVTHCMKSLGDIFYGQKQYHEATRMFQLALQHFIDIDDQLGLTQCIHALGAILYLQGRHTEAADKLSMAHKQYLEIGNCQEEVAQRRDTLDDIAAKLRTSQRKPRCSCIPVLSNPPILGSSSTRIYSSPKYHTFLSPKKSQ